MAGDWIKIEHATPDKPEVSKIADILGIDPDAVVGKLLRFWLWCDAQSVNGNDLGVTKSFLDRLTHQPGFSDALLEVDWLLARSGSLAVPHFARHNGQTAKDRVVSNRRVADHRRKKNECNGNTVTPSVTFPLQNPLPEKRREEKNKERERERPQTDTARRPTLGQAISAAAMIGVSPEKTDEWWHAREASEWLKGMAGGGTAPVGTNWQADLKTYASRGSQPTIRLNTTPVNRKLDELAWEK